MKTYRQLKESLPSSTVVLAFGRFNPPTVGHELLIRMVKKLAQSYRADYFIYASASQDPKKNPLSVDRKIHYLNIMFPRTNFVAAKEDQRTFVEAATALNARYKNLIMVAGSDRLQEFQKILDKYNGKLYHYDTIKVVSAGERDPDSDSVSGMSASKMRAAASKNEFEEFRKGLPTSMREIDAKRLMSDVRVGMGLEAIREQIKFSTDTLREQYFRGEIFNVGDIVICEDKEYEIVMRGTNYVRVKSDDTVVSKWITELTQREQ